MALDLFHSFIRNHVATRVFTEDKYKVYSLQKEGVHVTAIQRTEIGQFHRSLLFLFNLAFNSKMSMIIASVLTTYNFATRIDVHVN